MELISLQILFLLCLLLITLIGTYLPLVIIWFKSGGNNKQRDSNSISSTTLHKTREKILCFGNCFAAGTFFAMSFMHLVPETQKNWTQGYIIPTYFLNHLIFFSTSHHTVHQKWKNSAITIHIPKIWAFSQSLLSTNVN